MGGIEQKGKYKIDCRFNKNEIIKRIRSIALQKDNIKLFNLDALELIGNLKSDIIDEHLLFYFDPCI